MINLQLLTNVRYRLALKKLIQSRLNKDERFENKGILVFDTYTVEMAKDLDDGFLKVKFSALKLITLVYPVLFLFLNYSCDLMDFFGL